MTAPAKLAHIVFRTNQLTAMIDWYCKLLNARVVYADERIAFITYDDEHHRIALIATKGFAEKPPVRTVGYYHSAFTYGSLHDLLSTFDRLQPEGIRPWRTINHGPTMSFYYSDPDGNDIELQVDRFSAGHEAQEWMAGPAFASNPIGIDVDVEDLRRRLHSGEPHASIMRRADEIAQ